MFLSSTNHVQVIGFSNENALVSFQNVTYFPAPKKHVITISNNKLCLAELAAN